MIIISIKGAVKHVSKHAQSDGGIRSALHDTSTDARQLHSMLDEQTSKVETLNTELQTTKQLLDEEETKGREKDAEIATLNNLLANE